MFKTQRKFLNKAIVEPIKGNTPLVFLGLGLLLVALGSSPVATPPPFHPEHIERLGWTFAGAGVFSAILKSAVFTDLFQKHIADVIYHPENVENQKAIRDNWKKLTAARLKELSPVDHQAAVIGIENRFFDNELEYHFEQWSIQYSIDVVADGQARITNTMKTFLRLPKNIDEPIFRQTISSDGGVALTSVVIENEPIDLADKKIFRQIAGERSNARELVLDLRKCAGKQDKILFQRTFTLTQDLRYEPYITAVLTRYITGAVVMARITGTHEVKFIPIGLKKPAAPHVDGDGFTTWKLAAPQDLLLPGEGYILVLVPVHHGTAKGGQK